MTISDVVNGFVALGTIAMAWYSRRMIGESRKSIIAAERAARATEQSVEHMKDALMPYLALDLVKSADDLLLSVRNVGAGLARIRLATGRRDVQVESLYNPIPYHPGRLEHLPESAIGKISLVDFVMAVGDEFTFFLKDGKYFQCHGPHSYLSSLSLFYEDVYHRTYRSRLLYLHTFENEKKHEIRKFATEHIEMDALPVGSQKISSVSYYRILERDDPHQYWALYGMFSLFEYRDRCIGTSIDGTAFTHNQAMVLTNITIPWHGYPEFHLQIEGKVAFVLVCEPNGDGQQKKYDVRDAPESSQCIGGMPAPKTEKRPFSEYGLMAEGNNEPQICTLYRNVCNHFERIVDSRMQTASTPQVE